jgi:hypothetical protein
VHGAVGEVNGGGARQVLLKLAGAAKAPRLGHPRLQLGPHRGRQGAAFVRGLLAGQEQVEPAFLRDCQPGAHGVAMARQELGSCQPRGGGPAGHQIQRLPALAPLRVLLSAEAVLKRCCAFRNRREGGGHPLPFAELWKISTSDRIRGCGQSTVTVWCMRYRYDAQKQKRYKTVELVVAEENGRPPLHCLPRNKSLRCASQL